MMNSRHLGGLPELIHLNYLYPGFDYGFGYLLENIVYLQLLNSGYNECRSVIFTLQIHFLFIHLRRNKQTCVKG